MEKKQKTSIFGHLVILGQKGQFRPVFGQNGENYQKSAWNIFLSLTSPNYNCKVSEKSNERFLRKSVTDERTYERMYGQTRLLRSQRPVGQETKNFKTGKL